jgi:sodium/bile acid cotransporter 7
MKLDPFVAAMLGAVALAFLWPGLGASGGVLHLGLVTSVGVGLVFFLHGAALSPKALCDGAANWRLHLLVHASTFGLFPALGLAVFWGSGAWLPPDARLGVFYLCALSSTISSSVAMTALGKGNVAGAVFDATLSGLLGMVLTPLLVSLVAGGADHALPLGPAIADILIKLLLPFAAGQALRPWVGRFVHRHKAWANRADRGVILLIVYGAFCDSAAERVWARYGAGVIVEVALIAAVLLAVVLCATTLAARALGFSRVEEEPRQWRADRQGAVRRGPWAWDDPPAADDLPPAAADRVRRAGPPLRGRGGGGRGRLGGGGDRRRLGRQRLAAPVESRPLTAVAARSGPDPLVGLRRAADAGQHDQIPDARHLANRNVDQRGLVSLDI